MFSWVEAIIHGGLTVLQIIHGLTSSRPSFASALVWMFCPKCVHVFRPAVLNQRLNISGYCEEVSWSRGAKQDEREGKNKCSAPWEQGGLVGGGFREALQHHTAVGLIQTKKLCTAESESISLLSIYTVTNKQLPVFFLFTSNGKTYLLNPTTTNMWPCEWL